MMNELIKYKEEMLNEIIRPRQNEFEEQLKEEQMIQQIERLQERVEFMKKDKRKRNLIVSYQVKYER